MLETPVRFLTVYQVDAFLLDGQPITVTYAVAGDIFECRIGESGDLVPSSLFTIYLRNGLIGKVAHRE